MFYLFAESKLMCLYLVFYLFLVCVYIMVRIVRIYSVYLKCCQLTMCFEDISTTLGRFDDRLLTFKSWRGIQTPESLARAGFFYTQISDYVQCFYCHIDIGEWQPLDIPLHEHLRWSPSCVFANLMEVITKDQQKLSTVTVKISPASHYKLLFLLSSLLAVTSLASMFYSGFFTL